MHLHGHQTTHEYDHQKQDKNLVRSHTPSFSTTQIRRGNVQKHVAWPHRVTSGGSVDEWRAADE